MKTFKYTGSGSGVYVRDYSTGANVLVEKDKPFTTDSDWLVKELAGNPEVEEVKDAAKPEKAPPRKNGES